VANLEDKFTHTQTKAAECHTDTKSEKEAMFFLRQPSLLPSLSH